MAIDVKEDTQQRILDTAGAVFAEKGFRAATVREICHRARVNLAAVNYYFRDKERLYIESVKRAHQCRIEQAPAREWPPDTPATVKLRTFIQTLIARMVVDRAASWHAQLLMRELFQPTAACIEWVREFIRPQFELLLQILDELLPASVPDTKRHLIAFSIVGQCLYHRVARPIVHLLVGQKEHRQYGAERLAEHIADFSLAALGANEDGRNGSQVNGNRKSKIKKSVSP